jgi:hypothetical protein
MREQLIVNKVFCFEDVWYKEVCNGQCYYVNYFVVISSLVFVLRSFLINLISQHLHLTNHFSNNLLSSLMFEALRVNLDFGGE